MSKNIIDVLIRCKFAAVLLTSTGSFCPNQDHYCFLGSGIRLAGSSCHHCLQWSIGIMLYKRAQAAFQRPCTVQIRSDPNPPPPPPNQWWRGGDQSCHREFIHWFCVLCTCHGGGGSVHCTHLRTFLTHAYPYRPWGEVFSPSMHVYT